MISFGGRQMNHVFNNYFLSLVTGIAFHVVHAFLFNKDLPQLSGLKTV